MKTLTILIISCSILYAIPAKSQDIKADTIQHSANSLQHFKEDLKAGVQDFDSAKTMNDLVAATNHLGLIAKKYDDQWTANYYASYSLIILSFIEKDKKKKDAYLDDAEVFLNKTISNYKSENDELYVLNALFDNARLAVQPAARYKKYGNLFNENIDKAKSIQPNNPRIYYLKGNSTYYTPKMFGGGAKSALVYFEKADMLFQNENTKDIYKPSWGKLQNTQMLDKCKAEIK